MQGVVFIRPVVVSSSPVSLYFRLPVNQFKTLWRPLVPCTVSTSSPPQEKVFIWPPFFQYIKRLLRQKAGGACLYMPQDGHCLANFEVIPPPPKVSFSAAKNN